MEINNIMNLLLDLKERCKNYNVNINKENQQYIIEYKSDKNIKLIIRPSFIFNDIVFVHNLIGDTTIIPIHVNELYRLLKERITQIVPDTYIDIFHSIKNKYFLLYFDNLFLFNLPFHMNKLIYDYMNYDEYLICERHDYFYKILALNKYITCFYSYSYDFNKLKNNCFIYTYTMGDRSYANIVLDENEYQQVKSMSILQLINFLKIDYDYDDIFFGINRN